MKHNEGHHNFDSSPNIMVKSSTFNLDGKVKNTRNILAEITDGTIPLRRLKHEQMNNIKTDLKKQSTWRGFSWLIIKLSDWYM